MSDSDNLSAGATATKKASEGSGIIWCHDRGNRCIAAIEPDIPEQPIFLFARADRDAPGFDAALDELSVSMNRVANDIQASGRTDRSRDDIQIGVLRTGSGFLPVWKREVLYAERLEDLVDVDSLTDLDVMSDDELGSFLRIKEAAGEWRTYTVSHGVYRCRGAGMACYVTALEEVEPEFRAEADRQPRSGGYFATVQEESPVFDPALNELAGTLNTLVSDTEVREQKKETKDPRQRIGLVVTPHGLLPVWKIVEAYGEPAES
jgi:hypothetical protein